MRQSRPQPLVLLFVRGIYIFWRPLVTSSPFRWHLVALVLALANALAFRNTIVVVALVLMTFTIAATMYQYAGQFQTLCSLTAVEDHHALQIEPLVRSFVRNHDLTEQDVDTSLIRMHAINREIDYGLRKYFPKYYRKSM